ncbi:hypothetical protein HSB1_40490 [Halogranum salarium B-1]|uniref:Uncharacterized protein n=1 Tax=Halogranum salarium B-1 TaxID=1210908 RepID=J2ZXF8_9EURY|nr:hypothetical protein HSB1_40490 [Halogranum salarium B-1]
MVGVWLGYTELRKRLFSSLSENVKTRPTDEDTVIVEDDGIVTHMLRLEVSVIRISLETCSNAGCDQ